MPAFADMVLRIGSDSRNAIWQPESGFRNGERLLAGSTTGWNRPVADIDQWLLSGRHIQ